MRLETVKDCIANSPCISFEQFFTDYIISIQDINIDYEMQFLLRNNFLDSTMMGRLVEQEFMGCLS